MSWMVENLPNHRDWFKPNGRFRIAHEILFHRQSESLEMLQMVENHPTHTDWRWKSLMGNKSTRIQANHKNLWSLMSFPQVFFGCPWISGKSDRVSTKYTRVLVSRQVCARLASLRRVWNGYSFWGLTWVDSRVPASPSRVVLH